MINLQFPENELGYLIDKALPFVGKHKLKFVFAYVFFVIYFSLPSFQIPFLEYSHFRITSLMEQRAIEHNMLYFPKQSWISLKKVNPNLLKAIISMEDGNFFQHKGIDWKEIKTSIKTNRRRGKSVRGGSTITMQLAKNLYLNTGKNFYRKAKELLIAFRMEKEISKRAILRNYINAVEWGNGIFGIEEASKDYFHKVPSDLNLNECIRLAAVIPSPLIHKPNVNSNYVLRRSSIIRGRIGDIILFPKGSL
jgi:monofunctional biosynthetic peptidoglycan transglycosylase